VSKRTNVAAKTKRVIGTLRVAQIVVGTKLIAFERSTGCGVHALSVQASAGAGASLDHSPIAIRCPASAQRKAKLPNADCATPIHGFSPISHRRLKTNRKVKPPPHQACPPTGGRCKRFQSPSRLTTTAATNAHSTQRLLKKRC
jgi:hypothetical protein